MSVDTLRETFHINRIPAEKLEDFLTAQTYRPEITNAKAKIHSLSWSPLQSLCATPIRQGKSPKYSEGFGLRCIKPRQTRETLVSLEDCEFIDNSTATEITNQKLQHGDVVITRSGAGTIGRASIFLSDEVAYTNDHLFIVRTSKLDACYLVSLLKSYWGERLLESGISGSTGQLNLSNEHIKALPIYTPNHFIQKYIGDKVRQAERLRALSKELDVKLKKEILKVFAGKQKPLKEHRAFVSVATLNSNRMEAEFYAPVALWAENEITKSPYGHSSLGDLTTRIKDGPGGWGVSTNDYVSSGVPVIRSVNIMDGECDLSGCIYITESKHQELIAHAAKKGSVVLSVRGSVGRAAVFNDDVFMQANLNAAVVTIDCKPTINPYYLAAFLNSEIGKIQSGRIANGAVQQNMNLTETASNLIVVPPMTLQSEIATIYQSFLDTKKFSKKLTNAAKLLVEGLIEGLVTEAELIAAQQGLEAGDTEADAAILRRLKTDGLDGKGQPLFGDVERVYELLKSASQ